MPFRNRLAIPFGLAITLAATTAPVLAASPQDVADALTKLVASGEHKGSISFGASSEEGGKIVFKDVVLTSPTADKTQIGELSFENANVGTDGTLSADLMTAQTVSGNGDGVSVSADTIELTNAVLPPSGKSPKIDSLAINSIAATQTDKPPVTIASAGLDLSDYVDGVPHGIDLSIEGLVLDPASIADASPDAVGQLKTLGYGSVELNFYAAGSLDRDSGDLSIDELTIDGTDMGTLTFSGVVGGLSADVLKTLAKPDPDVDAIGKLTLKNAGLYYGDASLTGRVINEQAKKIGQEPAAFVDQITGALPLMLSVIGNQNFQNKIADGVTTFLKDPKNIAITVSPEQPVGLMQIVVTAQTAPQTLPDLLKADIAVNQDEDGADDSDGQPVDNGGN